MNFYREKTCCDLWRKDNASESNRFVGKGEQLCLHKWVVFLYKETLTESHS